MPQRKRKRSISSPKGMIASSEGGSLGVGDRETFTSIQGMGPTSQSLRPNLRPHSHEPDSMISPRHHHPPPPIAHSPPPPPHYQPVYDQPLPNPAYSPQNSNSYQNPHFFYHHPNSSQPYHNSPDHEAHTHTHAHSHPNPYSTYEQSPSNTTNLPPNTHAPSHYNFAHRAYAQQSDSGFNTFRVNPGPVSGPIAAHANSGPPLVNAGASLHSPPMPAPAPAPAPPSGHQHFEHVNEDPRHFRHRSYSHSRPIASTSGSVPASHARLSPPVVPPRAPVAEDEFESTNRNGATRRSRRDRIRNGIESPLTSSDDDDAPYNPNTAGGRSRAMVKYLIMKAKYRYILGEGALLKDELENLKREEHHQWKLKEAGVDEIIKSFGPDSDRLIHVGDRQRYLLDRDDDSADWDADMLRDLDRERHAFHEREREREHARDGHRHRGEYLTDVNHDDRGSVRHVGSEGDRDGDLDRMPMNAQLLSRPEDRDSKLGERTGSSSRSRYEGRLDSFHYSPHPYRRTPPPPLPLDRQLPPESYRNHSGSPAPVHSSSRLDKEDVHYLPPHRGDAEPHRERDRSEMELEYGRYPSPRQQRRRLSEDIHGQGQGQEHQSSYRSPPPLSHSYQRTSRHFGRSPSHSRRESTEGPDRSQTHREDVREHGEQSQPKYRSGPSSSPEPLSVESLSTQDSTPFQASSYTRFKPAQLLSAQEESTRQETQPGRFNRERSFFDESAKERRYEKEANTTVSSSLPAGQEAADGVHHDLNSQYPPSLSTQTQTQARNAVHNYPPAAEEQASSNAQLQTQMDSGGAAAAKTLHAQDEQGQKRSTTPSVAPLPPVSPSRRSSPRLNSPPESGLAKSPRISRPSPLSSTENVVVVKESSSAHLVSPLPSQGPLPSQPSNSTSNPAFHSADPAAAAAATSSSSLSPPPPAHPFRPNSVALSAADTVPRPSEPQPPRQKILRSPPISSRHPRYAYAYYPDEDEDDEDGDGDGDGDGEDVDMTHDSGGTHKGSAGAGASSGIGSNGHLHSETTVGLPGGGQTKTSTQVDSTTIAREAMDVDR